MPRMQDNSSFVFVLCKKQCTCSVYLNAQVVILKGLNLPLSKAILIDVESANAIAFFWKGTEVICGLLKVNDPRVNVLE